MTSSPPGRSPRIISAHDNQKCLSCSSVEQHSTRSNDSSSNMSMWLAFPVIEVIPSALGIEARLRQKRSASASSGKRRSDPLPITPPTSSARRGLTPDRRTMLWKWRMISGLTGAETSSLPSRATRRSAGGCAQISAAVLGSGGTRLVVLCVALAALVGAAPTATAAEKRPPNIVYVLADDLSWD